MPATSFNIDRRDGETDMTDKITVRTNWHRRPVADTWELSESERKDFDYLDWPAILDGRDSASFVRYRGELYDLGDMEMPPPTGPLSSWDSIVTESFFSGKVFRYARHNYSPTEIDPDFVIVGSYYC